jgi:tetratricopeptide (TPR) repeat protein
MMKTIPVIIFAAMCPVILLAQNITDDLLRAKAMMDHGDNTSAVSFLSSSLLKTRDSRLLLLRGDAFAASGKYTEAIDDFTAAGNLEPNSGEYGLARIFSLKGDVKISLIHLERNIGSSFRKSEKEIMLDPAFAVIENTPEWRLFWKKERYTVPEEKLSEIEYSISAGKRDDASELLKELTRSWPNDNKTIYAKALVDISDRRYSEAIEALTGLLSEDKDNPAYMKQLAKAQMESGNPAGASVTYGNIIGKGTADARVFYQRAECFRKTGEYDKALSDLGRYLELYPENREALSLAGRTSAESGDNLRAIEYYSRNLKLHPSDPGCYVDRANAYFVSRTWENAVTDFTMALDLKPDDPDVWLNKGIAQLSLGKSDDACHDFRKAMSLGNKKAASYISKNCIK